jgi:hypothetical protein
MKRSAVRESGKLSRLLASSGATASVVCVTLAVATAPALASHSGPLTKGEQKCRTALAKTFTKAITTGDKVSAGCHSGRNKGTIGAGVDCNDLSNLGADTNGKFANAKAKILSTAQGKCATVGVGARHEFVSCPEPCLTSTGVSNPLASYEEIAECLGCLAEEHVETRAAEILGTPPAPPLTSDEQQCHSAIAKGYGKHLSAMLKGRTKCQKDADKLLAYDISTCAAADPNNKISTALSNASSGVGDKCAGVNLNNIDSCSAVDVASLQACLAAEDQVTGTAAFSQNYELPEDGTVCPTSITIVTKAGTAPGGATSATQLDVGWNGLGFGQDLVHGYNLSVGLSCPNSSVPCGDCTVTGIVDAGGQFTDFARCKDAPSIPCANIFGSDPACAGQATDECAFFLGPTTPLSSSNTPICSLNRLEEDISGTVDPDTGESAINITARSIVHLGITQTQPCALCTGDPVIQDGVAGGTCFGGQNNGQACNVQATDATFANPAEGQGLSLDCVPMPGQNISGAGLRLTLPLTTGTTSLPFGTDCDFPLNFLPCACALCSGDVSRSCNGNTDCDLGTCSAGSCTGDPSETCATNADCDLGGCTSIGSGAARQPNDCSDLTCTAIGDGLGECQAAGPGDSAMYCDGQLRANGEPFLTCGNNSDCSVIDGICDGGNCGDCTISKVKGCFVDPVQVSGTPDLADPVVVTTFCTVPTSSVAVNAGLKPPGPARGVIQFETLRNFF